MIAESQEVTVRPARAEDIESILTIERLSFSNNFWDCDSFRNYDCIVAEIQEKIVGFLVSRELISNENDGGEREILNLAVHPCWRRRNIAKTLLKQELAQRGTFFLEVRESNIAARRLYETLEFAVVGKRDGYYANPSESAIVMTTKQ
jgi:ribosomal-protein-alanine N-acetyltransferase